MYDTKIQIIVVAAGSGSRFGSALPKQYCQLAGRPVVMHTIERLRVACPEADILLVISKEMAELWAELCSRHEFTSPPIVFGGAQRFESVRNALTSPLAATDGITLVHDGARPLIDGPTLRRIIDRLLAADHPDGVVPVVPVTDSLRQDSGQGATCAVDRSHFHAVQTPQAFPTRLLVEAYRQEFSPLFTDDASVMEAAGYGRIAIAEGHQSTIKITRPIDLALAELLIANE